VLERVVCTGVIDVCFLNLPHVARSIGSTDAIDRPTPLGAPKGPNKEQQSSS